MSDQEKYQRRLAVFQALERGSTWLDSLMSSADSELFDLESGRVQMLARLSGGQLPRIPSVGSDFGNTTGIESIQDLDTLTETLKIQLQDVIENPQTYGVRFVTSKDEESIERIT